LSVKEFDEIINNIIMAKGFERVINTGDPNCTHDEYDFDDEDYYYHCKFCSRVTEDMEITGDY
jgi:hypothetical protein